MTQALLIITMCLLADVQRHTSYTWASFHAVHLYENTTEAYNMYTLL